jgi:hypothetical protein
MQMEGVIPFGKEVTPVRLSVCIKCKHYRDSPTSSHTVPTLKVINELLHLSISLIIICSLVKLDKSDLHIMPFGLLGL